MVREGLVLDQLDLPEQERFTGFHLVWFRITIDSSVAATVTKDDVAMLGVDPGLEVDEAWWDDMLVSWFEEPEEEKEELTSAEASLKRENRNNQPQSPGKTKLEHTAY